MEEQSKKKNLGTVQYHLSENLPTLLVLSKVLFGILGATSLYTANTFAMKKLPEFIPEFGEWIPVFALAIAIGVSSATDYNLRKHLINAAMSLTGKNWNDKKLKTRYKSTAIFIFVIALIRLSFSMGMTLISARFMGDDITGDADISGLEIMIDKKRSSEESKLLMHQQEVSETIQRSTDRAEAIVRDAILAGPSDYQSHYNSSNQWFLNGGIVEGRKTPAIVRYVSSIKAAKVKAEQIQDKADKNIEQMRLSFQQISRIAANDNSSAKLIEIKQREIEDLQDDKAIMVFSFTMLDGTVGLLSILTVIGIAIVAPLDRNKKLFDSEIGFKDIGMGLLSSIIDIFKAVGVYFVGKVDTIASDVVDRIGNVTVNGKKASFKKAATDTPRRNATERVGTDRPVTRRNVPVAEKERSTPQKPVADGVTAITLSAELSKAKSNVRKYRSRIKRDEGNATTNEAGFKRWTEKVKRIEKELSKLT